MIDLSFVITMLQTKRTELLDQVAAIDSALAALTAPVIDAQAQSTAPAAASAVVLKPKRVLSDAHKRAMVEGRRRARDAKRLPSVGIDTPPEGFVPAIAQPKDLTPRLVKREFTVEPLEDFLDAHV